MKKFILADNALESLAGHFYEYDISVLAQIPESEFETLFFSNMDAEEKIRDISIPFFQCNFWAPSERVRERRLEAEDEDETKASDEAPEGEEPLETQDVEVTSAAEDHQEDAVETGPPPPLFSLDRLILIGSRVNKKIGHWWIYRLFQPLINRIYWRVQVWRMRRTEVLTEETGEEEDEGEAEIEATPVEFELNHIDTRLREIFRNDVEDLIEEYDIGPDDVIFFPNMNHWGLAALLDVIDDLGMEKMPHLKLLLRRNIFVGRPTTEQYQSDYYFIKVFREIFSNLNGFVGEEKLEFFTDTERLKDEHEVFSAFRFSVLPIPFRHTYIRPKSEKGSPLRVVYLGTARSEKGFQYLPDLVESALERIKAGEVEFVLQAVADPEPAIQRAVETLRAIPGVTLLDKPLDDKDYYELLNSGDILLLLYDPVNYFSRSSCIFVESMISGTPFITMVGSWMAHVMEPGTGEVVKDVRSLPNALEAILGDYDRYRDAIHKAGNDWKAYHNAGKLVRILLDVAAPVMACEETTQV